MRIKEVVYTITSAHGDHCASWGAGSVAAGARATAIGNPAQESFLARRLLLPSAESLRWSLHALQVITPDGEAIDRLILDGGARIGCLTEPGAPEIELRVKRGDYVAGLVENLEACQYVFRLTLIGPICDQAWRPRDFT